MKDNAPFFGSLPDIIIFLKCYLNWLDEANEKCLSTTFDAKWPVHPANTQNSFFNTEDCTDAQADLFLRCRHSCRLAAFAPRSAARRTINNTNLFNCQNSRKPQSTAFLMVHTWTAWSSLAAWIFNCIFKIVFLKFHLWRVLMRKLFS